MRIYFDNSEGGQDYPKAEKIQIRDNDTLGCGYKFPDKSGVGYLFYTHNGNFVDIAVHGAFDSREDDLGLDVFAAVGVTDGSSQFDVNFGAEKFKWTRHIHSEPESSCQCRRNPDEWTVRGLFKQLGREEPPQYGT
ncbi:hypothetical protein DFH07DRAFT_221941 [Mycena maculata]|uniref:Uncharacterized protein n=1 Tax=Mycena maculata TaxID=230809 RepID=A0AAD7HUE7_9AGAR|nr:hypothetical protein DFH07DRAFT_221941 [Mycena maculata]